ncbi:hypothetical protein MM0350_01180 [Helicobacter pylori]
MTLKEEGLWLERAALKTTKTTIKEKFMVTPLQSLRLPIGHPLVEILCKLKRSLMRS